jgi:hypothetical protein
MAECIHVDDVHIFFDTQLQPRLSGLNAIGSDESGMR